MHIPDGILSLPVLGLGGVLTASGIAFALKRIDDESLPKVAVFSAMFLAASLVNLPIGPTSVHLTLSALMGLVLGWAIIPAVFVALVIQSIVLGFGGLTTLGVNTALVALPGLLAGSVLRVVIRRHCAAMILALSGALAAAIAACGTIALLVLVLVASDPGYWGAAGVAIAANVPFVAIEACVTGFALLFILRAKPDLIGRPASATSV